MMPGLCKISGSVVQGRLEKLPPEMWANVLQQLSTPDLLRARLVSKHLVFLSKLLQLDMLWNLSAAKCGSLSLFVRHHCLGQTSPYVRATLDSPSFSFEMLWPCILLATECSNLRMLTCSEHFLGPLEAAACLRLLPSTLESLSLDATFGLIPDPALQRMQHLTWLSLSGSVDEHEPTFSAAGLQGLRSLQVLSVTAAQAGSGLLDAATFAHPTLTRFDLEQDPFVGGVDLAGLPALHTIGVSFYSDPFPEWLMEQSFPKLAIWGFGQTQGLEPARLLCVKLKLICSAQDQTEWMIADLLMMPRLQAIEAGMSLNRDKSNPLKMHGSQASHQALLQRLCLKLEYPFVLQLKSPVATIPLRKNGHGVVCICSACLNEGGRVSWTG